MNNKDALDKTCISFRGKITEFLFINAHIEETNKKDQKKRDLEHDSTKLAPFSLER